jgi:hypothetical protein
MEGHKNTDKENFYYVLIPKDPRRSGRLRQFVLNTPVSEKELEDRISFLQKQEDCKKEDIRVIKIYMPLEEFRKKLPYGTTYVDEYVINSLLKENEQYKRKEATLSYLAAEKLAENPSFFKPEKASEEAKEQFEEQQKNISSPKKGK